MGVVREGAEDDCSVEARPLTRVVGVAGVLVL